MSNPLFRKWVETLPDNTWAKKDLSACRLGWDAAVEQLVELLNDQTTIQHGTQSYLSLTNISSCIHALTIEVKESE